MSYRMFISSAKSSKPKSAKGVERATAMSLSMLSAKGSKFLIEEKSSGSVNMESDVKSSKSTKAGSEFGRVLVELEDSMSYSNAVVSGKNVKLQPKSAKKGSDIVETNHSSKSGKTEAIITVRSIDTSATLKAVDFTKMATSKSTTSDGKESSSAATIVNGMLVSSILVVSYYVL